MKKLKIPTLHTSLNIVILRNQIPLLFQNSVHLTYRQSNFIYYEKYGVTLYYEIK